ncbi:hypothetical protein GUJ93_ZPchr0003g17965 [Zizania palustris]|uniref:CSC1/OSCA1-like cytosolic domain-containing protein n=1 Tax=Zizania palustris TaxID=103762 RepID=A0A8J5S7M2_ZIZPA|nr:hypothetical protein GUJ93_ZPchr0003g17965 [Zizania palustris]
MMEAAAITFSSKYRSPTPLPLRCSSAVAWPGRWSSRVESRQGLRRRAASLVESALVELGYILGGIQGAMKKQPQNVKVYFGRRIAEEHSRLRDAFILERFVPSTGWIVRSLRCTEDEILATAGLDAVVFNRILVFSIRIFSLAAFLCVFGVLPLNYFGQDMIHVRIPSATLETFTIGNMQERSRWLWVHCVVLYIISGVACLLLYLEYTHIARLRLLHVSRAATNPSHFTVLVRGIPKSTKESFSCTVESFFNKYHASGYLSHQVISKVGKVQKIVTGAKKAYRKFKHFKDTTVDQGCKLTTYRCGLCGASSNSFQLLPVELEKEKEKPDVNGSDSSLPDQDCGAAFVFFKTRYAALIVSEILQTSNPMKWVTSLAPERDDVYWSNLWSNSVRTAATKASFSERHIEKEVYNNPASNWISSQCHLANIFIYCSPNHDAFFYIRRTCSLINQVNSLSSPKDIPMQLARAVPVQATFFTTYVLTSGGLYWPIAHNTTIFSMVLTQIICLGVFGLKNPQKRLLPLFKTFPAQDLIDMDREDEQSGRMDAIHQRFHSAYCQFVDTDDIPLEGVRVGSRNEDGSGSSGESSGKEGTNDSKGDLSHPTLDGLPISRLRHAVRSLGFIIRLQKRGLST